MSSLFHWGILGMKWGRRGGKGKSSRPQSEDHKTAKILGKKKVSEMSNDELKKLTTRLQLEKQFKDLASSNTAPGQKFIQEIVGNAGKQLASKYIANSVEQGVPNLLKMLQNLK